jgi:hypothetical protein
VSQAPVYAESGRAWVQGWSRYYERLRLPVEVRQAIDRPALQVGDGAVDYARGALFALVGIVSYLPWVILVPILVFFLLKDADRLRRMFVRNSSRACWSGASAGLALPCSACSLASWNSCRWSARSMPSGARHVRKCTDTPGRGL